ncbi:VOC family protein [Thermoactinospora rubra]|uniref:VOC family protein n=1 Tax=Thermoactinospora rubra TaxID=1088767 RepID=UPI000A116237|nr:VOC family protein [Thermoactinospora rubra]
MSVRDGFDPGVPCWVDLSTTDVEASVRFYGELFGWEAEFFPQPEAGGYGQFRSGGKVVAGVGPVYAEGMPSVWNVYVCVEDAAACADRVKNAGGQVLMEPMQVFDQGRMAVFQAADGSAFSVWQPGAHKGAELVNEPGAFCWAELDSTDVEVAARFYGQVFGWEVESHHAEVPGVGPFAYHEYRSRGHPIAGMAAISPFHPQGTPSHWLAYFAVADLAATHAKARELGAAVLIDSMPSPKGEFMLFQDPQGAHAYAIQLNEPA